MMIESNPSTEEIGTDTSRRTPSSTHISAPAKILGLALVASLFTLQFLQRDFGVSRIATTDETLPALHHNEFHLASYQSYGFFDDISSKDWKLYKQRFQTHHDHPDEKRPNPRPNIMPAVYYMNNYDPLFTCPHPRRVGGQGDGPKWTCDPHRLERVARERKEKAQGGLRSNSKEQTNCLIYSVGSAGKYEWEEALAKSFMKEGQTTQQSTCEIHVFDFSKNYTKEGHASELNIHFHQWGLKSSYDDSLLDAWRVKQRDRLFTLPEIMEKLGHTGYTIDILKIDCEFCEWFTYEDWLKPELDIRQLLLEVHNLPTSLPDPQKNKGGRYFPVSMSLSPNKFFDGLEKAGFAMFSKEPNIHPLAQGNGVEFAYIKLHPDFFKAEEVVE
ncbi:Pfam:DUF672 [Seminavis robusta]|uniref:Pfam:DUF672 n=1 Tax=Seminavis robusta TaxID=568900 RepID=A0A9N8DRI8_9STRA|nr:Pfam:DUF672 [Seminavis robusta]|eukprot:Sro319_g116220.1 Pfam:DUF672 (386) ;mRNA; r:26750-28023